MNYEVIYKLIEEGLTILYDRDPPGNDPDALRQLKRIANAILSESNQDAVADQKCGSMIECAETAFAARRRPKSWTREEAARFARADLIALKAHVEQGQRAGSPPTKKSPERARKP